MNMHRILSSNETPDDQAASRTPHSPEYIGIYRAFKAERGGYYLHVSLKRNGKMFQKYFSEKRCGGESQAMRLAKAWRDNVIALHPPISMQQFCSIVRSNNTSGVAGVSRIIKRSRRKSENTSVLIYWQARIPLPSGTVHARNFSVLKLGEDRAKELAINARMCALDELNTVPFNPKNQPRAGSSIEDMAILKATLRASAEKQILREGERAAKRTQKAERASEKLSQAIAADQAAISTGTNRSSEPYIGRYQTTKTSYWRVSMIRNGIRHRKCFSDSVYGGRDEALQAAKLWRDHRFATLSVRTKGQVVSQLKATNTSGVAGVSRILVIRKGKPSHYWVAHSPMEKGKSKRTKRFSIDRHGDNEALELARAARENFVNQLGDAPFLHSLAARKMLHMAGKKDEKNGAI